MSVIDASVFVDALVGPSAAGAVARFELRSARVLEAPAVFGAETISALRRLVARGTLNPVRASVAIEELRTVRITRFAFEPFARRIWELRDNLTVYDAWYVALAEALGSELVTSDAAIVAAPGTRCRIRRPGES